MKSRRLLIIRPSVCGLKQGAQVVDLARMIQIMGDHDADDDARRETFAPIGQTLAVQFRVVGQRADGGKPAAVSLRQPGEKLLVRARTRASLWNERRLVAAHRGGTEGVVFIHPLAPANMFKNIGDRAATALRRRGPIFFAQVLKVGEQRMFRVTLEGFFDEPGEGINRSTGV